MSEPEDSIAFVQAIASAVNADVLGRRTTTYDIMTLATLVSSLDAARYYADHMLTARNFSDRFALLSHALTLRMNTGLTLEFGVATGATINHIAEQVNGTVHGFDSFKGLPKDWRTGIGTGMYAVTAPPEVRKNVELHVGRFEGVLKEFVARNANVPVSFLHIDCDLYDSTRIVLESLRLNLVPGTVIVFDEYLNYAGWRHHEFKAFQEFVEKYSVRYHYDSFVSSHQQVCVIIDSIGI